MLNDYDEYYDTIISRSYGRSKTGTVIGPILIFIGLSMIVITIVDMYITNFNKGQGQTDPKYVYTWDENPFWPTYGKGFWVGLILSVTGVIGIVSACEHTLTSIFSFVALCIASAIFSFYLLITTTIPLSTYGSFGSVAAVKDVADYYYNSLALNAVLMSLGGLGLIVSIFGALLGGYMAGCCKERRGYGAQYIEKYLKTIPANMAVQS